MVKEQELIINILKREKAVRQATKNHPGDLIIFQPLTFFGSKYNHALVKLAQEDETMSINLIDFAKAGISEKANGQWIEKEIEQIYRRSDKEFSVICFLNINEISGTALEKALLPFFDYHQNTQYKGLDLSNFILVATSSTSQLGKISPPLLSRLKCVNREEVKLPKTFVDKHFNLILVSSILLVLTVFLLVLWPKRKNRAGSKLL